MRWIALRRHAPLPDSQCDSQTDGLTATAVDEGGLRTRIPNTEWPVVDARERPDSN